MVRQSTKRLQSKRRVSWRTSFSTDRRRLGRPKSRSQRRASIHYKKSPYGKRTRGWQKLKPQPGVERHRMHKSCAKKCFLDPAHEKFPICAHGTCKRNCKGILSAKIRAKQYHYNKIANKADAIGKRLKCSWTKKN